MPQKMHYACANTPEAAPILGESIRLLTSMQGIAEIAEGETVRENFSIVPTADAYCKEVKRLAITYNATITQVNTLLAKSSQFARDAHGIQEYLMAPLVHLTTMRHFFRRIEGAGCNGMDKKRDFGRASYIGNVGFFSSHSAVTETLKRVCLSLGEAEVGEAFTKAMLNFVDTPWDVSRIQFTDDGTADVRYVRACAVVYIRRWKARFVGAVCFVTSFHPNDNMGHSSCHMGHSLIRTHCPRIIRPLHSVIPCCT